MTHRTPEEREIEQLKLELWRTRLELDTIRENILKLKDTLTFFLELDKLSNRMRDIEIKSHTQDPIVT